MILKALYLKIGDLGLPVEFTYGFLKKSRFICNYIEREVLKKIRFRTENFDRIVISVCSKPAGGVFVNSAQAACVDILFDREVYERLYGNDLALYYIDKLQKGLEKCAEFIEVPKSEIFLGLKMFVTGGMKNEWTHKRRKFSKFCLKASLKCEMTQELFLLRLEVARAMPVFEKVILETDPDENAFEYRFKDLTIDGQYLVVTSKTGDPLWREPISNLIR